MPLITYETMFLLESNKVSSDAEGAKQQIHHLLERHGGQVIISRPCDYNHKLSYPISKQKKGSFHIIYYTMESTHQAALERDFALAEGLILRQLTLKLDPKWRDAILGVARDDAGNGFAVRGMQEESGSSGIPGMGGDMMGLDGDHMGGSHRDRDGGGRRSRRSDSDKAD
jgi:small subunit ribosomal protein S6